MLRKLKVKNVSKREGKGSLLSHISVTIGEIGRVIMTMSRLHKNHIRERKKKKSVSLRFVVESRPRKNCCKSVEEKKLFPVHSE